MIKKSILTLLFIGVYTCFVYSQQIITDNSQQPDQLIQNAVASDCASVSNISSSINGSLNSIISYGSFDRGTSNFPLQNGIVLSTGNVLNAGNTVVAGDLSDGDISWTTDSDVLDILGIDQTLNATSIEFDFVTVNNFIAFKYIFASEEYQQEYPCNFRDVFAILIKRAGTADPYTNIAVVPDTSTEISTNTVRPNINGFCDALNEDYFGGYNIGGTNFNGQTTVMIADSAVIPGETYHIKFIIADHIDERFDSAVFIETEGFGGAVDLGPDQTICGNNLTLDAEVDNPLASYSWFLNGTELNGENDPTLDVSQSGTYHVEIGIPGAGGNCILEDSIEIEIVPFQEAAPISYLAICDDLPNDGIYDFNFPLLKDSEIYDDLPSTNYTISYHLSEDDALNNINPILGTYQNTENEEIIFVRIESLSGDCLQIGNFGIRVDTSPNTMEVTLNVCNGIITSDFTIININSLDFPVSNFEFGTSVTYHLTEEDALNGENNLTEIPSTEDEPPFFFARVTDIINGCSSIVSIYFDYQQPPTIDVDEFLFDLCFDPNFNETIGPFTLTYENVILTYDIFGYYLEELAIMYPDFNFRILELLVNFDGTINGDGTFYSPYPSVTVPIGVSDDDGDYCEIVIPLIIHKNLLFNTLSDERTVIRCDDASNDGIYDFDLNNVSNEISDGYEGIQITYYETPEDRDNGVNAINPLVPFTVDTPSRNLYITSTYSNCMHQSKITLEIEDAPIVFPQSVEACGEFDAATNTTRIQLNTYIDVITQGLPTLSVEFYANVQDAENGENAIENIDVAGNTIQLFYRATLISTGCFSVSTLDITILEALELNTPDPIVMCDDDQDGFAIVNLESVLPELAVSLSDFEITFYETLASALLDRDEIENPESYNSQTQTIYLKLQHIGLECFTVIDFEVSIHPRPFLIPISDFINCTAGAGDFDDFYFQDKDSEIINGQIGMEVFYFETENDAVTKTNPIDKTVAYQNTSNPQTIFVRIENEIENSCFRIAPMQIEVRQAPDYNVPNDIFECDINNTGFVTVDLSQKITEIEQNSTTDLEVSFHLTSLNANEGTDTIPLNFTSTSNPQLIYARIENPMSNCFNVETFYINTLQLPEVNYGQTLIACANNYMFEQPWDLTKIEIEILEGRQFGIQFSYFESEEDLQNNTNVITNPESFINSSSPQTIYAKVENTITGCFSSVPFELIINGPPQVNDIEVYKVCDNEENFVDLSEIDVAILDDTFNVLVSYHSSEADAEANINALDNNYIYINSSTSLFARVQYSTTRCYAVYQFQLEIEPLPVVNQPENLEACDDDFDGVLEFDLSTQNIAVLNGLNADEYTVSYFDSEDDALQNINALDNNYTAYNGEVIFVRLENNETGCFDMTQFSVLVNPLPEVAIEDQVICLDDLPLTISADTGNPLDSYLWSTGAATSEIEIVEVGDYSVTVTNEMGCQTTSVFSVTESESATINVVEVIDFSDPNNITVTVEGMGNYLYRINDRPFQTSNVFENVPIGYNTITIIDQNGCSQISIEVLVMDFPKHLTPNGDGDFDFWHISGAELLIGSTINIFDRYGKLLKQLQYDSPGWDGTFNGKRMPAGDYWFVAEVKRANESFVVKGHFALVW